MKTVKFTKKALLGAISLAYLLSSCSNEVPFIDTQNVRETQAVVEPASKQQLMESFAQILSKACYEHSSIRTMLKEKALQQFDKNYDVLYQCVKGEKIEGKTFRDILVSYSSEEQMGMIENSIPRLNVYVSDIPFFNVTPENLDINDKETPVAVAQNDSNVFYVAGKEEGKWAKGGVPDFHVFVVNENSRVVESQPGSRAGVTPTLAFKSPNYDGSQHFPLTRADERILRIGTSKALLAYTYFNKDDGSRYQKGLQRDFIYYGITPTDTVGHLNHSVTEYISTIKVSPRLFNIISDQFDDGVEKKDPRLIDRKCKKYGRALSDQEVIDRLWSQGTFDLKFTVITSTAKQPLIVHIPLRPQDIWDFHIQCFHRHGNMFRRKRNIYAINPDEFTAKTVYLDQHCITFGKWDLSKEALDRYVKVEEDDESIDKTETYTFESNRLKETMFNNGAKITLGLGSNNNGNNVNIDASVSSKSSNTVRETYTSQLVYHQKADDLGMIPIYYYDPIIDFGQMMNNPLMVVKYHTYGFGGIEFTLDVR